MMLQISPFFVLFKNRTQSKKIEISVENKLFNQQIQQVPGGEEKRKGVSKNKGTTFKDVESSRVHEA